jgi:hypothetical protein
MSNILCFIQETHSIDLLKDGRNKHHARIRCLAVCLSHFTFVLLHTTLTYETLYKCSEVLNFYCSDASKEKKVNMVPTFL